MILEIIGAVALTGLLVYVTLGNLAIYVWSDYGVVDTTKWNWKDLWHWWIINIVLAIIWWYIVGSHITIGFA